MRTDNIGKIRLFLDMDGMLAEYRVFFNEEQYLQKGYYTSLRPHMEVIDGIKMFMKKYAGVVDVRILSAYFESKDSSAVQEKNEWLDKWLPEIKLEKRIYTICGTPKFQYIEGPVTKKDFLMDDYTNNLVQWESAGGSGIKLLTGLNGRTGVWDGTCISYKNTPEDICRKLEDTVIKGIIVKDKIDECQIRNDTDGLTMYIPRDVLEEYRETYFQEYESVGKLMFAAQEDANLWRTLERIAQKCPDVKIKTNTSIRQFEFEYDTFCKKAVHSFNDLYDNGVDAVAEMSQILMSCYELSAICGHMQKSKAPAIAEQIEALHKKYDSIKSEFEEQHRSKMLVIQNNADRFFTKYNNMSAVSPKEFAENLSNVKSSFEREMKDKSYAVKVAVKTTQKNVEQALSDLDTQIATILGNKSIANDVLTGKPTIPHSNDDLAETVLR